MATGKGASKVKKTVKVGRGTARPEGAKNTKGKKPIPKTVSKAKPSKVLSPKPALAGRESAAKATPAKVESNDVRSAKEALANASKEARQAKPLKTKKISVRVDANEALGALTAKWNSLFKKAEQIDVKPYNMRDTFEEKTAITHKTLGWGYILANRNDRLEVLFQDGVRYLISNYKA
jgi:hypothetical protein